MPEFEWQQSIEQEHAASIEEAPVRLGVSRRARPNVKASPPRDDARADEFPIGNEETKSEEPIPDWD